MYFFLQTNVFSYVIIKLGGIMYAEVITELKARNLDKTFTYKIPSFLMDKVKVGCRVLVPFGKQRLEGFVLNIDEDVSVDYHVREIIEQIDEEPVLNDEMLKIADYISKKTLSTRIQAYQTMLPTALKAKINYKVAKKYTSYIVLSIPYNQAICKATTKQGKSIVKCFLTESQIEKKKLSQISSSALLTLFKKNIVSEVKKEVYRFQVDIFDKLQDVVLTEEQKNVYDSVMKADGFSPFLLHGVTGSGKTEVYMALIDSILKNGKEALVLVPEISLTPQFIQKFTSRFGGKIAVLHSKLSNGEKYDEWRKIQNKEVSIVIGARSAIFAPLTNIGIIILDEEHSPSYKQENIPRYHVSDIALFRGKYHHAKVIFGSATPSIQSYTRAKLGIYTLLEMKNRLHTVLPQVHLVQMRDEMKNGYALFSKVLLNKIQDRLDGGEQIMILLNKRGYARVTVCHSCGYTDSCPHCDIPLTYHKSSKTMRCHYCGYGKGVMKTCTICGETAIDSYGIGTQKVEEELRNLYPDARIIRMDADTTITKNAYAKIVNDFKNKKYDILVGTQMIAKGHDFDFVTLVGVLNADATLYIPDFQSGERTFALLNQVAGRAGRRNKVGEVIFQGFNMNHYSIESASRHDYASFYKEEMRLRKMLNYPPYCNLALIEIRSKSEDIALLESQKIRSFLDSESGKSIVLGPTPSLLPKKNDYYYFKIILKYKKRNDIIQSLIFIDNKYKSEKKVNVEIDLNPNAI